MAKKAKTSKKTSTKATKATKTVKATNAQQGTDKKAVKNTIKKVVKSTRELKYKYPADMENTVDRKSFRQTARNKMRSLERAIASAENAKEKDALKKELKAYRAEVLLVP